MKQEFILRRAICEVGKLLYDRKLVVATDGNISIRLDRRNILITPAGFCKGFLSPPDIIRLPLTAYRSPLSAGRGSSLPRSLAPSLPSSETPMHLAIFRTRPDVNAIVHAHPPYATSFAASGRKLDSSLLPETTLFDGPVGRAPFVRPGSDRLAQSVARVLKDHKYCLLARHGAVSTGKDLLEAYYRLERLEFLAQVTLLSARR
jgi:L-fuculose-phosphate aldolase